MERLSTEALTSALAQLPGWSLADAGLEKTYRFADYYRVMAFVNAVAYQAHADDHHPDLSVHYDRVTVRFTTHDAGGVTARDAAAAVKVESLHAAAG